MTFFAQNEAFGAWINGIGQSSGMSPNSILIILLVILLWSMVWKMLGLWKSARKGSVVWFIILTLTNTVGILPILYIYAFSKIDWNKHIKFKIKKPNIKSKLMGKKRFSKKKKAIKRKRK